MADSKRYLYRGENSQLYKENNGKLIPKSTDAFLYTFKYGESDYKYGSGGAYGISPANAVLGHQINSKKYPTSGISATPHFERACYYALGNGKFENGYIFKIDCDLLESNNVKEWLVAKYATHPSVPEDDEVILVSNDFGVISENIIAEIIPVSKKTIKLE